MTYNLLTLSGSGRIAVWPTIKCGISWQCLHELIG